MKRKTLTNIYIFGTYQGQIAYQPVSYSLNTTFQKEIEPQEFLMEKLGLSSETQGQSCFSAL